MTADCIVLDESRSHILLIERRNEPFKGCWAFPGGFMEMDETLSETAFRELLEETGIEIQRIEFFCIADGVNRDPRGRVISAVFQGIVSKNVNIAAGDDAANVKWFNISELPLLAFDHDAILNRFLSEEKLK
jgi:8-oxo-dGTP diphosphatase